MKTLPQSVAANSLGGLLWLDLVNTEILVEGRRVDLLPGPPELLKWLAEVGIGGSGISSDLAAKLLTTARKLRQCLRLLAEAIEAGGEPSVAVIQEINNVLSAQARSLSLKIFADGYRLEGRDVGHRYERFLSPIAESAADFLVRGERARLRPCANPVCLVHFYDTTKNQGRRFCSPAICGNRAKVAAHYRRRRQARQASN